MTDKTQIKNRIIEVASEKFRKIGIKKVTTDEIAREVGISKRTLYEIFSTKIEIAKEIILNSNSYTERIIKEIKNNIALNPLQKINEITKMVSTKMSIFNIQNLTVIKRDLLEMSDLIEKAREEQMRMVFQIFQEGVAQGIFRTDIKPDVFFTLFQSIFDKLFVEEISHVMPLAIQDLMDDLTKVLVRGVLTKEAIINGYLDYID
jgi:TetR/AcrR family transcriptional regulator, cholesterol catabolism regulator